MQISETICCVLYAQGNILKQMKPPVVGLLQQPILLCNLCSLMKFRNISLWIGISLLFACSGVYHTVEFETLKPATLNLPDNVSQLLTLNRLPADFINLGTDSVVSTSSGQPLILDTLISNNIFRGLYAVLRDSPLITFHWPIWSEERQQEVLARNNAILTKREVIDLCSEHYSDAILSLESFHLSIENEYLGRKDTFVYTVVSQLISKATWFIYLPQSPKPFNEFVVIDTLGYWTSRDMRKPLLPDLEKLRAISYESGLSYGQFVSPVWSKTERSIYSGRALELKEGSELTEKGEWDKAYTLWNDLSHNGRRKNRARAFYNMAVFYELEDQLDSASYLVDQALSSYSFKLIQSYKKELDLRLQSKSKIIKQVKKSS